MKSGISGSRQILFPCFSPIVEHLPELRLHVLGMKTIKVHRGRMMGKMRVQSVAELVRMAEKAGVGVNPGIAGETTERH